MTRNKFFILTLFLFIGMLCVSGVNALTINDNLTTAYLLDENTGTTAGDEIGTNDGTISGATWTTGKINSGLDFDGSNDDVSFGNILNFGGNVNKSFSLSYWVNPDTHTDFQIHIAKFDSSSREYQIYTDSTGKLYFQIFGSPDISLTQHTNTGIGTGTWKHITLTYDGGTTTSSMKIYIDGQPTATTASSAGTFTSPADSSANVFLGTRILTGTTKQYFYDGQMDEVYFWDRALTSTEVEDLYDRNVLGEQPLFTINGTGGTLTFENITANSNPFTNNSYFNTSSIDFYVEVLNTSTNGNVNISYFLYNSTDELLQSKQFSTNSTNGSFNLNNPQYDSPTRLTYHISSVFPVSGTTSYEQFCTEETGGAVINYTIIGYSGSATFSYWLDTEWVSGSTGSPTTVIDTITCEFQLQEQTYSIQFFTENNETNVTSTNYTFTVDTTLPTISFNNGTEFNNQFSFDINDILNVSCSDTNFDNCSIYWEDNTTSFSSTGTFIGNKTVPEEVGNFTFNIIAYDLAGNIENVSGYIYINPYRLNISFYSGFSGNPLYNISLSETTLGNLGNSGDDNYIIVFADPATYNFTMSKTGYRDMSEIIIKDNITIVQNESINLSATFNFFLKDERTLGVFNLTPVSLATIQVICLDESVIQQTINSTNITIDIPCSIRNIKFILDYTTDSYFRSILVDETEINRDVYLIDLTTTQSIFNTFTVFDLTQVYENPRISFKKYVGTNQVEITGDVIDVEGKVPGYFILNDQYIMELSSDNMPTRSLGFYSADTLGDRVIKLFSLDFKISETNKVGKVNLISYIQNGTVYGVFNDTTETSTLAKITIYNATIYGNVVYTAQLSNEDTGSFSYNVPDNLENTSLFVVLEVTNSLGTFKDQRTLRQNNELTWGLINFNLSQDWIITVFLGFIGLLFTASTATTGGLLLMGLAALFVTFGWYSLSWYIISLGIILAILKIAKEGDKQ